MEIDKSDCLETYYSRVLLIVRSSIHMHTSVVVSRYSGLILLLIY